MEERIYFRLSPPDVIRLGRILEGSGHLGLLSTVDIKTCLCVVRTTSDCMADLKKLLQQAPIAVEFVLPSHELGKTV